MSAQLEAMWLCEMVGLCAAGDGEGDDVPHWRTAVHESGRALVLLVEGTNFERIRIYDAGPDVERALGEVVSSQDVEHPTPSFEARVASDVGGAVAEHMVFGCVEPLGVWTDLRVALARAHVTGVDDSVAVKAAEGLGRVREQIMRVRHTLRRRRPALEALAAELLRTKDVTRRDAVRIVRQAGTRVRVRPIRSSTVPWQELRDCNLVRAEIAERAKEGGRRMPVVG